MRRDKPARKISLEREKRSRWKQNGSEEKKKCQNWIFMSKMRELLFLYQLRNSLERRCCGFPMINWFVVANSRLILLLPWVFSLFQAISYRDEFGGNYDALVMKLINAIRITPWALWFSYLKRLLHGGFLAGDMSDNTYGQKIWYNRVGCCLHKCLRSEYVAGLGVPLWGLVGGSFFFLLCLSPVTKFDWHIEAH